MAADESDLTRREVLGAGAALGLAGAAPAQSRSPPAPARPAEPRIEIVCGTCGGRSVTRDAWAEWDVEEQEWVLGAAFDYSYCHDCDEETRLEEVQVEASVPAPPG